MIYYTYKITCTEGRFKDKIYFGQHQTENLDDNYKGSGVRLRNYYKKHPEGYIKEILNFYNNIDDLNKAEKELIEPHLGKDYCLNLIQGGLGHISKRGYKKSPRTEEHKNNLSKSLKGRKSPNKGIKMSEEWRKHLSEAHKGKPNPNKGKKFPPEVGEKISKANKGRKVWNKGLTNCYSECYLKKQSEKHIGKHRVYDNPEKTKWHME